MKQRLYSVLLMLFVLGTFGVITGGGSHAAFAQENPVTGSGGVEWGPLQPPSPTSKLYLIQSLNGNVQFYVDTTTIHRDGQGNLTFNVLSYSPEQRQNGGYTLRGPNTLDCKTGIYQPSYGRQDVDSRGEVASDNGVSLGTTITLRNDGFPFYGAMKTLCVRYGGLSRNQIQW